MAKYSAGFPDYIPGTWKHTQMASPKWPIWQVDAGLAPLHSLTHVPILSPARYSRDICTCQSDPSRQMETYLMFWWSFCDRFCRALARGVCVAGSSAFCSVAAWLVGRTDRLSLLWTRSNFFLKVSINFCKQAVNSQVSVWRDSPLISKGKILVSRNSSSLRELFTPHWQLSKQNLHFILL